LTHAKNATRHDAHLALLATEHILDQLTILSVRSMARAPEQCPLCGSFKITVTWRPDQGSTGDFVAECDVCGAIKERVIEDD
jgi:hypothetical protein